MANSELSRRERKKIESRARILKAARALFQGKDYDSTSVEEIAERADVSKSTFFNYFPTKESLLDSIAADEVEEIEHLIEADLVGVESPVMKIRIALKHFAMDSISFLKVTRKVMVATIFKDEGYPMPVKQMEGLLVELIEEAQKREEIAPHFDPDDLAKALLGMYFAAFFKWIKHDQLAVPSSEAGFESFLDIIFTGIAGRNYLPNHHGDG
ncbi:MAG TPA: TetR/AcrR family transcriptional regulator [Firmicutes bacterium]|nr:TetR/AcrR family transcriptional regulator [Bacillota bacterium]